MFGHYAMCKLIPWEFVDTNGFAIASSVMLTVWLLSIAISRGFEIAELNLFAMKLKLPQPISVPPSKISSRLTYVFLLFAVLLGSLSFYNAVLPLNVRQRLFSCLRVIEITASEIDDYVTVKINGVDAFSGTFGNAAPWKNVTELFRQGMNTVDVAVQNGLYGGCGARVQLRINGALSEDNDWQWGTTENKLPGVICFQTVKTVEFD